MFYSELTRLKNVTVNLFQNLAIGVILPNSFLFRTVSSKELLDLHLVRSPARSRRSRTGGEHARERAGAGRPDPPLGRANLPGLALGCIEAKFRK